MIERLEELISDLCSIYGSSSESFRLTTKQTFPKFPVISTEDDQKIEKIVFAGEELSKALNHLMEARKILFILGFRKEEAEETT